MKLKYLGGGFIPGVPAEDHECSEAEAIGRIRSGVYADAAGPSALDKARGELAEAQKAEANALAAKKAAEDVAAVEAAKDHDAKELARLKARAEAIRRNAESLLPKKGAKSGKA